MPPENETTSPELAVLYERISRVLDDYQELRGMVIAQNQHIQQFVIVQKDITILDAKTDRLFKAISAQSDILTAHSSKLQTHATIWRICGAVLMACSGLIGWGYSTVQALQTNDNQIDRRIMSLEYQIRNPNQGATNDKGSTYPR